MIVGLSRYSRAIEILFKVRNPVWIPDLRTWLAEIRSQGGMKMEAVAASYGYRTKS
jgi:hypothetical protein